MSEAVLPTHPNFPHQWRGYYPVCIHCGINAIEALKQQPETKGVGPCQVRLRQVYPSSIQNS